MRTLIVYYSVTGHTRAVAQALADQLAATLCEIKCQAYTTHIGPLRQAFDVMTGRSPDIDVPEDVSRAWDLVVLGGPVWGARPAPPVRRYLKGHIGHTSKLALFVTCNGTSPLYPPERAITEMVALAPQRPMATRVFNQAQISGSALATNVASFAAELAAAARL